MAVGLSAYKEYRGGDLSIIYFPRPSHLDVWHRRKVLTINRRAGPWRMGGGASASGPLCSEIRMTDDARALQLYELALSQVEARGSFITVGLTRLKEYRAGSLLVRYQPTLGWLEVWAAGKVLSVKRQNDTFRVTRYRPGYWEEELEAAVK